MAAQTQPLDVEAFTIDQFCLAHGISRRHFYDLKHEGKAPRLMQVGTSVRIAREAAAEWRREREREAEGGGKAA
jgi:predicted DNA-binding transcriptional regulator AlpA